MSVLGSASAVAGEAMTAREVKAGALDAEAWDAFAKRCGCSLKGGASHIKGWKLKNALAYEVRMFEVFAGPGGQERKVAQCAVGLARRGKHFVLDRLQIPPEAEDLWGPAFEAVLRHTGPGLYEYGWELNLEPPRDDALSAVPGLAIEQSTPIVVQAVDFSNWDSWDAYYWGLRKGARQSAQFAYRDIPDLGFVTLRGWQSLLAVPALLRLKASLSRRKHIAVRLAYLITSYLGTTLLTPEHTITRLAKSKGQVLAAYYGTEFGGNFLYLEAASVAGNQGASWALLLSMIQRAYEQDPQGKFIMGYVNYALHDEELSGGLIRSRTACRVTDYPTTIVTFRYQPA